MKSLVQTAGGGAHALYISRLQGLNSVFNNRSYQSLRPYNIIKFGILSMHCSAIELTNIGERSSCRRTINIGEKGEYYSYEAGVMHMGTFQCC